MAISSGSPFYNTEAFQYDEATGEVKVQDNYPGAALLFDLPLDPAKANPEEAEAYLNALLNPAAPQNADGNEKLNAEEELSNDDPILKKLIDLQIKIRSGEAIDGIIPGSVKEVSYDKSGNMLYSYENWQVKVSPERFFAGGKVGYADTVSTSSSDDGYWALLFHKDEDGVITGRIIVVN